MRDVEKTFKALIGSEDMRNVAILADTPNNFKNALGFVAFRINFVD